MREIESERLVKLLSNKNKFNLNKHFNYFYKFRFDKDYLKFNTDKNIYPYNQSKQYFKENKKKKKLFYIYFKKSIVGLIIYNLDSYLYSITISKKFRKKKIGQISIKKFIKIIKKKKLKLKTYVHKKNKIAIRIHKKYFKLKGKTKNFIFFQL